jgi:hypothetical protein
MIAVFCLGGRIRSFLRQDDKVREGLIAVSIWIVESFSIIIIVYRCLNMQSIIELQFLNFNF